MAVEHCLGAGSHQITNLRQTPKTIYVYSGSQLVGDKLHRQKGNSPDRQLRSLSVS
jgi:hypothetical protein